MAKPNPLSMAAQVAESLKAPERPKAAPPPAPAAEPVPVKASREGKRFLGYYVEPLRHEEIKQAALDEGIQIQELLRQAVDRWMDANGAEAVAVVERRRARKAAR
ncbi:hypothetical protein [Methylobacterium longum]|uniref:CopG family transcriptional regulator n=1 Tax=Methylobacterium longum TaxID=767694 RepID=A0ABT8AYV3_9HYPH|nr:hypothetical protein [Methylobacterium longum]MDN3575028.1 hypothetical protein [Methylobacterium longum]GJE15127.1 hypothetical protein FOHLNKBM_6205 [Methylobacterium longum]